MQKSKDMKYRLADFKRLFVSNFSFEELDLWALKGLIKLIDNKYIYVFDEVAFRAFILRRKPRVSRRIDCAGIPVIRHIDAFENFRKLVI